MKLAGLAVVTAMAMAGGTPKVVVPASPDLTIRTRATLPGRARHETVTVQLKGARQLTERTIDGESAPVFSLGRSISQCDQRRTLFLNPAQRTYGYLPIEDPSSPGRAVRSLQALRASPIAYDETKPRSAMTIDAVDTGERRQFAGLTARHVITTTKTYAAADDAAPISTRVQDGWYVDLPPLGCVEWSGESVLTGYVIRAGESAPAPPRITFLGRARRGFALIETDRTVAREGSWTQTTELVEISDRPIDPSVFEVPDGYRPALPQWGGGFDLSRPDTLTNRAVLLWEGVRDFASRYWR